MPLLFLKTGWMARYCGFKADRIFSTMRYVTENEYGHERNNFKSQRGKCFGYAPVAGVDIKKHFGATADAKYVEGIDVVWASNRPQPLGGLVIIGWYRNARVYRHKRPEPSLIIAEARAEDCTLLPVAQRLYELPLKGPGAFRSTKSWYGEDFPHILHDVENMVAGTYHARRGHANVKLHEDPDLTHRAEVEKAAITRVTSKYVELGFAVKSVEDQNLGWDLEAKGHGITVLLEVKGTAHRKIMPLLTPNEYNASRTQRERYHLCIVTDALSSQSLVDLRYASEVDGWVDDDAKVWDIEAVTSGQARPRK